VVSKASECVYPRSAAVVVSAGVKGVGGAKRVQIDSASLRVRERQVLIGCRSVLA
jgi:hypothetical protein